jgi:hypothetical protein
MTHVPPELPAEIGAMVIAETAESITVAIQVSKATLLRNMHFLEALVDAGTRAPDEDEPPR